MGHQVQLSIRVVTKCFERQSHGQVGKNHEIHLKLWFRQIIFVLITGVRIANNSQASKNNFTCRLISTQGFKA